MEMLSVKNAIERMVQNYITAYTTNQGTEKEFFGAIERLVASFFVGGQIDNNYLVRSAGMGIEISFSTKGHCTRMTFILPPALCWKPKAKSKPLTVEEFEAEYLGSFNSKSPENLQTQGNPNARSDFSYRDLLAEGSIRVGPKGTIEVYTNGKWTTMPNGSVDHTAKPAGDPATEVAKEFDPFEAYERAKKAVKSMI